jgi:hypothetical protein
MLLDFLAVHIRIRKIRRQEAQEFISQKYNIRRLGLQAFSLCINMQMYHDKMGLREIIMITRYDLATRLTFCGTNICFATVCFKFRDRSEGPFRP